MIIRNKSLNSFHVPKNEFIKEGITYYSTFDSMYFEDEKVDFLSIDKFKYEFIKKLEFNHPVSSYEWKLYYYILEKNDSPYFDKPQLDNWRRLLYYIFRIHHSVMFFFNKKRQIDNMYANIFLKSIQIKKEFSDLFSISFSKV